MLRDSTNGAVGKIGDALAGPSLLPPRFPVALPGCLPVSLTSSQLPLLITGITGVVGFNALHYFQAKYPGQVIGLGPCHSKALRGEGIVTLPIEDVDGLRALFAAHRFRTVLDCLGNCALKSCELDPVMARRLNVEGPVAVAEAAAAWEARLVHLSSDLVFSGTLGRPYLESDSVDPVTIYGKTMAEAEDVLSQCAPDSALLRISLPMGRSFNRHAGAIDWIQSRFRAGRPATLYFDEVRSITYTDDLNRVCERFLAGTENGLYHLGGPRSLTLYQIGQIVNRVGGYDPQLLHGCPRHAAGPMPPRAGDVTMDSGKLVQLLRGSPFREWPVGDELTPRDREWHFRRVPDEGGCFQRVVERLYHYPSADLTV